MRGGGNREEERGGNREEEREAGRRRRVEGEVGGNRLEGGEEG